MSEMSKALPIRNTPAAKTENETPTPRPVIKTAPLKQHPYLRDIAGAGGDNVLLKVLASVRRNMLALFCCALLGLLAGLAMAVRVRPVYSAGATIELMGISESFLNLNQVDPTAGPTNDTTNTPTQLQILESGVLRTKVYERMLQSPPPPLPKDESLTGKIRQKLGIDKLTPAQLYESSLLVAAANVRANVLRNSRIVEIRTNATHPVVAAGFINVLVEEYIAQAFLDRSGSTSQVGRFLSDQVAEARSKLETSEAKLQAYANSSGLVFLSQEDSLASQKLRQLQMELTNAQADRISKQTRYEQSLNPADANSLPEVLADAALRQQQAKLAELQREYSALLNALTPSHPKVQQMKVFIRELEAGVNAERQRVLAGVKAQYDAALLREKLLQDSLAAQSSVVLKSESKSVQYNILKREVDTNRQILQNLLQRSSQAGMASSMPMSTSRLLDKAYPPQIPITPRVHVLLGTGLSGGIALCIGFLFLVESRRAQIVTEPGRVASLLNTSELGVIPSKRAAGPRPLQWKAQAAAEGIVLQEPSVREALGDLNPLILESFRLTLASILFSKAAGRPPQLLAITSANPGEGKTFVCKYLGIAMAGASKRTLLIDCDVRRPALHDEMGVPGNDGWTDLMLSEDLGSTLDLQRIIRPTVIPNLYVLPVGSILSPDLFYSGYFRPFLARLREEYGCILLDTPPVLHFSDARVLGQMTDGMILVVRSGVTPKKTACAAHYRMISDGVEVLGTILNDYEPPMKETRYYYDYRKRKRKK